MTFTVPLQVLLEPRGGGDPLDITKWCTGLRYGSRSPGGYAGASFTFHRKLADLGTDYGQYSPFTVLNTETAGEEYEGLLDDPGRSSGPDGESYRMTASGVASTAKDIDRPYVAMDSDLQSWGRGLAPFMREQVTVDTDTNDGVSGPGIVLTAPSGTLLPVGAGIGYVHYLPMIQSRQLIGALSTIDVCSGQDAGFVVGHDFGMDSLDGVMNAAHAVVNGVPFGATLTDGVEFTNCNTAALAWARVGSTVIAGENCWVRWGAIRVKPIIKNKTGTVVTGTNPLYTTWREILGDLLGGSGRLSLVDGGSAYLDDDNLGPTATQISHLMYPDGVTAAQLLEDLLRIETWATWLIWGKTGGGYLFEWRKKPTDIAFDLDTAYEAVDIPGSTAELWSNVNIRWRDPLSNIVRLQSVGTLSPILEAADIVRETTIDLGDNVYADPAAIALKFLQAYANPVRSGTVTITRPIYNELTDQWVDPWQLPRVGPFRFRIAGTAPGSPGSTPDGISVFDAVACEYDADANAAICELDQPVRWAEPPPVHYGDRRR